MKTLSKLAIALAFALTSTVALADDNKTGHYAGIGGGYNVTPQSGVNDTSDVNVFAGHRWDNGIRFELDYDRFDSSNLDGNMFSANLLKDFNTGTSFRPFIGAGVGYLGLSDDKSGPSANGLAYIGTAGLLYEVTPRFDLYSKYRYIYSEADNRNLSSKGENFDAHSVTAGVVLKF